MEILLIACMLAYVAGAQSEQSKLGLSPAQRDILREQNRHEKAVQRIAEKHSDATVPRPAGVSPWKEPPSTGPKAVLPETFLSGYRSRRASSPSLGRRAGEWTGKGITWAQDTGKDAWRTYRERRKREGHDGPELVLVPMPPEHPPTVPPMPTQPPTAGAPDTDRNNGPPADVDGGDDEPVNPPETTAEQLPDGDSDWASVYAWKDEDEGPSESPNPSAVAEEPEESPNPGQPHEAPTEATTAAPAHGPAQTGNGVGRMAAEVTYESVMDESDELALMCEDDARVYDRIRDRAEREIGRGDELLAALENAGFGPSVIGWVARCKEQYQVIHGQLDELQANTIAQGEKVVQAKGLLENGQGIYADIAKDMEDVADRQAYISDAVDAEDTSAHTEIYETKVA